MLHRHTIPIALLALMAVSANPAFASKASALLSLDEGGFNLGADFQVDDSNESVALFGRFYPEDKDKAKLGRFALGGFLRLTAGSRSLAATVSMGASLLSVNTIDDDDELLLGPAMALGLTKRFQSMSIGLEHFMAYSWFGDIKGTSPIIADVMFVLGFNL